MSENPSKSEQPTRARARTAKQLARQERCFELSIVRGKTVREIAAELRVAQETVIADLRAEEDRRRDENSQRRECDTACAIAFYQHVIARAMKRADIADTIMELAAGAHAEENDSGKWVSDRSLETAMKARERIDKLLGLEALPKAEPSEVKIIIEGGLPKRLQ